MRFEHVAQIAELEKLCFSTPWSEKALIEEIENENARFFVAVNETEVLAYGGMHLVLGEGFVTNIAVSPKHRRKDIAKTICEKLISLCDTSLSLEVRQSNEKAINLYKKLGFEEVGKRKNFYQNPSEDGLIYTKFIM